MHKSMNDIVAANNRAGQVWFNQDTMRFWETELYAEVWPTDLGTFFVTSDRDAFDGRSFSVRFCDARGRVATIQFQEHAKLSAAKSAAKVLAVKLIETGELGV